jgi:hypothetical protein
MAGWIERYKAGEHAEVWAEMQALGSAIAKPSHRKGAAAVANETMKRCRANVDALFAALPQIGYSFQGAPESATPDYPLELRIQGALAHVQATGGKKYRGDPWSHPALAWVEEEDIDLPAHHRNGRPGRANFRPPSARTAEMLDLAEKQLGRQLPLAVRRWFETVGSVNLSGTHPILNPNGAVAALRVFLEPGGAGLPAAADAGAEFIAAIRHAFAWGGFPGWSGIPGAPERELAWLRSKLVAM